MTRQRLGHVDRMQARKQKFLEAIADGFTVGEACEVVGTTVQNYHKWRRNDPEFKAAADAVKAAASGADPLEYTKGFAAFRKEFFNHDSSDFHLELIDHVENAEPGTITLILLPPEHGKTTTLTDWVNYKLGIDPNHKILYVSETAKFAMKIGNRVRMRMTEPMLAAQYIQRFGPFYEPGQGTSGKPWTDTHMTVARAMIDSQEYSFEAAGIIGSQIYGTRPDTIVCDDMQTLRTLNQTDKIIERFTLDVVTRVPMDGGRIIVIMTRLGNRDVPIELLKRDIVDRNNFFMRPAIRSDGKTPLWKERYTPEMLARRRKQVTEKVWQRAYMMRPQADGTATFDENALEGVKDRQRVTGLIVNDPRPKVAGLDPALGGGCALTVAQWGDTLDIIDCEKRYELGKNEDIFAMVKEFHLRYGFSDLIIEAVGFQKGLARDERFMDDCQKLGIRIHEHVTGSNKLDEASYGVAAMAASFTRREITFPWGDEHSALRMDQMFAELLDWRPFVATRFLEQDLVMSLWFIWYWWMQARRVGESMSDEFKGTAMPFKPIALPGKTVYHGMRY